MEEWRVSEYSGYEVSSFGRVRSVKRGKPLSPSTDLCGYQTVSISVGPKKHTKTVHRLVAKAFIAGNHSLDVNHIDGNKANNFATNLEWVTRRENILHSYRLGLPPSRRVRKITPEMGDLIWLMRFSGFSDSAIGRELGLAQTSVGDYLRKLR